MFKEKITFSIDKAARIFTPFMIGYLLGNSVCQYKWNNVIRINREYIRHIIVDDNID